MKISSDFTTYIPDIGAETIVSAVKDVLLKLQLQLANCRGQCYDGASNMPGHRTGVLSEENPGSSTEGLSYPKKKL